MIPGRLRLRNFMCYRQEQSLDFSGIHLACLAGDNGHGKSTLLDAMTWALWGKARAQRDDDLIALGENEMWVEFEFGLAGQRYRIWRQRSRRGRGQSDLHFYAWNAAGDDWQLLDEGGLRERQAQITRTLRMEYETFVNSAFLLQGKADSFTVKTPAERKQILGDILGLGWFDAYEARAKEEAQARKERAGHVEGEIAAMDRELGRRDELAQKLQAAQVAATAAAKVVQAAEAERERCQALLQERQAQARRLAELDARLLRAERDLQELNLQQQAAQARLDQIQAVLAQRQEVEAGWNALLAARADDAGWNARLLRHTQLGEEMNAQRLAISQATLALEGELRRLQDRERELARKAAAGAEQVATLAEIQQVLAVYQLHEARREAIAGELRGLVERGAALRTASQRLTDEGQAAREKITLLAEAQTPACPLCGQPLEEDHRDRMQAELQAERDELAARYQANAAELHALSEQVKALEREEAGLVRELKARDARQRQAAQVEAVIAEGERAAEERARLADELEALQARIDRPDYAPVERARLAQLEAALPSAGYDAREHQGVRARLQELEPYDARYNRQLLPALDGLGDARERVGAVTQTLDRRQADLVEDRAERERLAGAVADLPALQAVQAQAVQEAERAAQAERRARQEEGAAMQQLDALAVLEGRKAQRLLELAAITAEISIFNQLREAFGKKGLQAMIIESAIPEVEVEANQLLGRMTEGRMSLRLETQREKVTGGVAETLDIIISDELGARPYEMYSGGESFRANLALRIAISKLLARRSGAQLQTLVVDEGFGTQDTQGRALLVEAIHSIQGDFERILVITHIEELKDLFPARIEVVKTPEGSQVTVT